jgi:excisionase family DNA binding protein
MNKKETAEFLGISIRQVEKYASDGRFGEYKLIRGRTGKQADYDREAVEKWKHLLESPDDPVTALTTKSTEARLFVASLFEAITSREEVRSASVRVSEKLLLTVKDCQLLTGLSEQTIRDSIRDAKLKARVIGRGLKVKRTDLDKFISKL